MHCKNLDLAMKYIFWFTLTIRKMWKITKSLSSKWIFSCESDSTNVRPTVRPSVCSPILRTPFNLNPSSFSIHPSSFNLHSSSFNFHHSSFILWLLSFSACFSEWDVDSYLHKQYIDICKVNSSSTINEIWVWASLLYWHT